MDTRNALLTSRAGNAGFRATSVGASASVPGPDRSTVAGGSVIAGMALLMAVLSGALLAFGGARR